MWSGIGEAVVYCLSVRTVGGLLKALRRQAREERAVALEEVAEPIPGPGQV